MSSILEALKKLEEEKAEANQAAAIEIDDITAERDLFGGNPPGARPALQLSPAALFVCGLVFTVVLVAVSVGLSLIVVRSHTPPVTAVQAPVAPITTAERHLDATPPAPVPEANSGVPAQITPPERSQPHAERQAAPPATPASDASTSPPADTDLPAGQADLKTVSASAAVPNPPTPSGNGGPSLQMAATPAEQTPSPPQPRNRPVIASPSPVSTTDTATRAGLEPSRRLPAEPAGQAAAPPQPKKAQNLASLPILTETVKARYSLTRMKLNMTRPANAHRPQASAIINAKPVFEGERIPGSEARLIGVLQNGIAIEIIPTGEQFYSPI